MEKHLHIICLNIPYPVDYGGVFDLFYKLPALQQQGILIHLHCFEYGRGEQPELNKYCKSVQYYERATGLKGFSFNQPYIVSSRNNEKLLNNLLQDNYPILMEGIHCTALLDDSRFAGRKCFVRLHNVEHIYYKHLFQSSTLSLKKLYYKWESSLLFNYEKQICSQATFFAVSQRDVIVYKSLGCKTISFLPLFLPDWTVKGLEGNGSFCLYQGDLSVHENQKAAKWLLKEVFDNLDIPLVIAGKNPPDWLSEMVYSNNNACLVSNPKDEEMQDMISKAHLHVIPSFNATGIKLKLVNALFNGRHVVVNKSTVEGTGLEDVCTIANDIASFKVTINKLFNQPFEKEDYKNRQELLNNLFNNENNAKEIVKLIFDIPVPRPVLTY